MSLTTCIRMLSLAVAVFLTGLKFSVDGLSVNRSIVPLARIGRRQALFLSRISAEEKAAIELFRQKYNKPSIELPAIFRKNVIDKNSIAYREFSMGMENKAESKIPLKEIPDSTLSKSFRVISQLYGGTENALEMVKAVPLCLAFNPRNFAPVKATYMKVFTEPKEDERTGEIIPAKFTESDVIAMVVRNPLLMGMRSSGKFSAEGAKEDTMYMSYVIAATRPLGPYLLGALLLLLASPTIKVALGL